MRRSLSRPTWIAFSLSIFATSSLCASPQIHLDEAMSPPTWALLEIEVLETSSRACEEFYAKYFDTRGWLKCVERWGGDDGPDDAIENCGDWPILHALGGSDNVLRLYKKAWEGHLEQYTKARTVEVPFAREGMYHKEFPVMFDWQHNAEGLRVFNLQGLSDPHDREFLRRVRRYAGFYMAEDPGAPNYDPKYKVIRSLFNGSRGPLLRKTNGLDWAGDRIDIVNRFNPLHGERNYAEMLEHFKDYNETVGDHPLNLLATTLALNAYMATGDQKYKDWLLEYVDAWYDRMVENGNILPSNVGLDGTLGGECDGRWYGGTYGWGFTVIVPQTGGLAHRNRVPRGFDGFMNAYLLSGGDDRYLEIWRKQMAVVNAQMKMVDGKAMYPRMYGDDGWYAYTDQKYTENSLQIYYLSMRDEDRSVVPPNPWLEFLDGSRPDYPERALAEDLARIRSRVLAMRADTTSADTRLADDPMGYNPAVVRAVRELMIGALDPGRRASALFSRIRYFDPTTRRAGIPPKVASLVHKMTADETAVTIVNTDQLTSRELIVQAGAYAEHEFVSVEVNGKTYPVNGPRFTVFLDPGAGADLRLHMRRFVRQPAMAMPWDRAGK